MSRLAMVLPLLALCACGGEAERNPSNHGGSGGPSSGGSGGSGGTREVVDDMDNVGGAYPSVPEGSSSFFWRGGLGNWFVTTSDGVTTDAAIEEIEGGKACHASGTGEGVGVDLWAQLAHPTGGAVDLSRYAGLAFTVRLTGTDGTLTVAFGGEGRYFTEPPAVETTLVASDEWQSVELDFAEVGLEPRSTSSIDFVIAAAEAPFDLWIDDLIFICDGPCP